MKLIHGVAILSLGLALPFAAAATPNVDSAVIMPRVFNDCPGSLFTSTNNYPAQISMTDVNQNCFGFANLHLWRLSTDGATAAQFANGDGFRVCADLQITGSGQAEAGLQVAPWWSDTDGRLNVKTTDGEIAAFGGRLPFYSFSDPSGFNLHYVKGTTLHMEIIYRPNSLTEADPGTIEYIVNGNSSGPLPMDEGNPAEGAEHGNWGILTPAEVGGHFQFFLADSGPTGDATVTWSNICFEPLGGGGEVAVCPKGYGFWKQQCAQRNNGSTKVCQAGMENLWRCLITNTGIIQWRDEEGSFVTTASLAAMNNGDLFSNLCEQLQKSRHSDDLDQAEIAYIVLQLNVCAGALSPDLQVMNDFQGTVGDVLDSLENAINTGHNLGYWADVAGHLSDDEFLDAECEDDDGFFRNIPPCVDNRHDDGDDEDDDDDGDDDHNGSGNEDHNGNGDDHASDRGKRLDTSAYPNPVITGSTSIVFRVPETSGPTGVDVAIYDLAGRLVKTLVSEVRSPGTYSVEWDLRNQEGVSAPSGIYFYRVLVGDSQVTRKVMISH